MKAQHVSGPVPYGFRIENHHYVVVPEEAQNIREIFRHLDGGESIASVARWAAAQGIKTHQGFLFNEVSVTRLTQCTLLIGRYTYGRKSKDKSEPIVIENAVEPILEPDIFWRQYEKTAGRRKGPRPHLKEEDYLLTGYLYCEYCGAHLYGFKSHSTFKLKSGATSDYVKYSYRCATKGSRGSRSRRTDPGFVAPNCELKNIEKEALEDFVFGAINNFLFTGNTANWIAAEMLVRSKKIKPANDKKVSEYKSELEKIKRRRDRLLDLYLSEGITKEDYSSKADELTRREAFLSDELKRLCPAIPTGLTAEVVLKKLKEYANSANADSPQYKRRLLSTYVDRITVSNERIVIYFKFTVPGLGDSVEKEFGDYFVRSKSQTP